jgi:splicing factor 3A subunit 3
MLIEEQRFLHEDLERLEQGISDRIAEDPRNVPQSPLNPYSQLTSLQIKDRLNRDHQIAGFLTRIQEQSQRLLDIYKDAEGIRKQEIQTISTGDPFDEFYKQLEEIKDFHRRYPNEPVENLERAYKRRYPVEGEVIVSEVDNMFSGEEANGRFLDLTTLHEDYLNLPNVKRITYLQYLDQFDAFTPPQFPFKQTAKLSDQYFKYVGDLASYLESFCRRTKPLEDLDAKFASIDAGFEKAWNNHTVPGWTEESQPAGPSGPKTQGTGEGIWCPACEKEFKNENVYKNHLTGKKHLRAAEALKSNPDPSSSTTPTSRPPATRLKERAIASREFSITALSSYLSPERTATRVNVERKQGMTERERQQELEALFAEESADPQPGRANSDDGNDSDTSEKIYNPLKLPLAWDGKPIPYWLYKLHGLGVEFPCEICGNFVYRGRRAFDKHFSEERHVHGLKCLGITNTSLFREITGIEEALALWEKVRRDKEAEKRRWEGVVQMEDREGNVMPERVYLDLQKQGIL